MQLKINKNEKKFQNETNFKCAVGVNLFIYDNL